MRFWIDSHGCAKNQVDAEEMAARLEAVGHEWASGPEAADLIVVNTCGFIESAKKESIEAIVGQKRAHPGARVLAAGCLSQRYAAELAADLAEADGVVGNSDMSALVRAAEATASGERFVLSGRPWLEPVPGGGAAAAGGSAARGGEPTQASRPALAAGWIRRGRLFDFPGTAHVKISEGCSNDCSYCAIPLIRGPARSRPADEIVDECAYLVGRGIREIVLIGQDLGSYRRDPELPPGLPSLLGAISRLEGDFRVRLLYIHPDHFPEAILPLMAADPRFLPYFDVPFQHASARVLKAMNRKWDAGAYLDLVGRIRAALPDAVLRSTFLVGFPGETDEDFALLRDFQDRARLDWLGAFAYSREEGTPAASMATRVPKRTALARKKAVEEAQEGITRERMGRFVGRVLEVLVEERIPAPSPATDAASEDAVDLSIGRSWLQAPEVDGLTLLRGSFEPGTVVRARVLAVRGVDLDAAAFHAPRESSGSP
jgi:ribosomal protein S12 methylthiotransferase